jgi:hypothetical protein
MPDDQTAEAVTGYTPSAWGAFGDGHDYSRTGKHDPLNCRFCLRDERDRLKAALQRANRFDCPECGCGIAVDEDGCCRSCGADATPVLGRQPEDA